MFGNNIEKSKKFYIINNAINVDKYTYNEELRTRVREKYNIKDEYVVGNISRMSPVKNLDFLINVFYEILKIKKNSKLLLVGDGPIIEKLKKQVEDLNIQDKVIFTGVSEKTWEELQAMDVFVIPSFFEGGPITMFEAAASGLKYIISDKIIKKLKKNDLELQLSLNSTPKEWAEQIVQFSRNYKRCDQKKLLEDSGYDIKLQAVKLKEIYKSALKGVKDDK